MLRKQLLIVVQLKEISEDVCAKSCMCECVYLSFYYVCASVSCFGSTDFVCVCICSGNVQVKGSVFHRSVQIFVENCTDKEISPA